MRTRRLVAIYSYSAFCAFGLYKVAVLAIENFTV